MARSNAIFFVEPFLDLCVSSLREGHANLLCIVPILTDVTEVTQMRECEVQILRVKSRVVLCPEVNQEQGGRDEACCDWALILP